MSGVTTKTVAAGDDGSRLDHWFKRHYPTLGLGRLQKLLRTGQVRVDGGRVKGSHRVSEGETVRIPPLPDDDDKKPHKKQRMTLSPEDQSDLLSMVLHRDDRVIILNKPPGLAVQGGSGMTKHLDGMLDGLCFEKPERPRLVHRLDKDTSGVLVLARDARAARDLGRAFQSKEVRKLYWALLVGYPQPEAGVIDLSLLKLPGKGGEKVQADENRGDRAITIYRVLERAGKRLSWVAMEPQTGRTHQLRVHALEALGCPILGDGKYGAGDAFLDGGGLSRKLHLHARAVSIPHPDGKTLTVQAGLPSHFTATLDFFGFDADDEQANAFLEPDEI